MENVEVSVIMLVYNQADTVRRAVDSVLAQKFSKPFEILLCDDASTDDTPSICRELASANPDKIRLNLRSRNVGVQKNYYDALLDARGEYIADCSGDDFWINENRMQLLYDGLSSDPDAGIIHSSWKIFNPFTGELSRHTVPPVARQYYKPESEPGELLVPLLSQISSPLIHLSTALYRRQIITDQLISTPDIFYNPAYGCEDLQLTAFIAAKHRILYLPVDTLAYSVGQVSISNAGNIERRFRFHLKTVKLTDRLTKIFNLNDGKISEFINAQCSFLADLAFESRNRELAAIVRNVTAKMGASLFFVSNLKLSSMSYPLLSSVIRAFQKIKKVCISRS